MPEVRAGGADAGGDLDRLLDEARARYRARDWVVARDRYRDVQSRLDLGGDDLYALANCSWWLGELDRALPDLQQAYRRFVQEGELGNAALAALDIGYTSALRGDEAQASGWLGRAYRHVDQAGDCAEHGYLRYIEFEQALESNDLETAGALAQEVGALGQRFDDATLRALGVLGSGRVALAAEDVPGGMALLDEAMVAAVSDDLDPGWAGNIYCNMMMVCYELADWPRASEWTDVTKRWCEAMPGAGPFLGICRVHRAQVLHARGDWDAAEAEARRVCDGYDFIPAMVGEAWYALAELQRQRGRLGDAEGSYRRAHQLGRDPCPGFALLRLAQGRRSAAVTSIGRAREMAAGRPLVTARMLPAAVEILLAVDDATGAAAAARELAGIASRYATAGLLAQSQAALGAVALAERQHDVAALHLEQALRSCQRLCTPYEVARVRLMLADAHRGLGHADAAALEADAARAELSRLGATVPGPTGSPRARRADGLSEREAEILDLLADGKSNQEIASQLVLSVRTVERHLATVYRKLGLHGRSARTAAVRHALGDGDDHTA